MTEGVSDLQHCDQSQTDTCGTNQFESKILSHVGIYTETDMLNELQSSLNAFDFHVHRFKSGCGVTQKFLSDI